MSDERTFHISTSAIIKVVLVLLVLWFLYVIRDVIALIFVSFVLASAITPWVDRLQQRRIPRVASVIGIYVLLFGVISIAVVLIIPPLVEEIRLLASRLPDLYKTIAGSTFGLDQVPDQQSALDTLQKNLDAFSQGLLKLTSGIFGTLSSIFGGVASFVTVLVIVFYITVEEQGMKKLIQSVAPIKYQPYLMQFITKIQTKMGSWLRGQLLLSLIIGVVTYLGLSLLGVKYAVLLALLAGIFEIIPFIGPILAAIPAVFFAATDSTLRAFLTAGFYIVIQQLENAILVPKVMQQTVGLNPLVILIAVLVGARVAGFLGVVLAVPVAAILGIFLSDLFEDRRAKDAQLESEHPTR
ncbi:MAG: AI-2E family transporter [Candidatus Kerfeldbacteria bacterium]|nr:AI-2E family transporter [Candidatus Kerfeldbacteria bacterium]